LRKSSFLGESLFGNLTKEVLEKGKARRIRVMMMEAVSIPVVGSQWLDQARLDWEALGKGEKRTPQLSAGSLASKDMKAMSPKKGTKGAGPAGASKSPGLISSKTPDKGGSGQK